jgi:hypothetical protein
MPQALLTYLQDKSLLTVPDVQNRVQNDYIADMAKYASNADNVKIRAAYQSIPVQLAKDNKKFQYKLAQRGGTSTLFGAAIDWLHFAGIVLKCQRIEHAYPPIAVYSNLASFKLYMNDTGMLTMKSGMPQSLLLSAGEVENTFLGAVTENYVAQSLAANHPP